MKLLKLLTGALLVAGALTLHGTVVYTASDTFDGVKAVRTIDPVTGAVDSFEWYSAGPTSYTYVNGVLVNSADRSALGFLTEEGEYVNLSVGQTITVSTNYTYDRSGGNTGDRMRVALYRSVANPDAINSEGFTPSEEYPNTVARPQADYNNNSSVVASGFVNLYTGLIVCRLTAKSSAGAVAAPNVAFYERVGASNADSVIGGTAVAGTNGFNAIGDSGGNAFEIPSPGWYNTITLERTPLYLTLSVTYKGVDGDTGKNIIDLDYKLYANYGNGNELVNYYAIADHLTDVPMSFDAIALYGRSAYPNYNDMTVTVTEAGPAPFAVPVLVTELVGGDLQISCASVAGYSYQLESGTDLSGWSDDGAPQSGDGGDLIFTRAAPASGNKVFYRVTATEE